MSYKVAFHLANISRLFYFSGQIALLRTFLKNVLKKYINYFEFDGRRIIQDIPISTSNLSAASFDSYQNKL